MESKKQEQATFSTPILDSILAKLPPPKLEMAIQMRLTAVKEVRDRLEKKLKEGTLTQADIERELSSLPDNMGGIEDAKQNIVKELQVNLPLEYYYDIKKLPLQ